MNTRSPLRGLKLQLAIRLVAEGNWTDQEVAKRLHVTRATLEEIKARPYFADRLEEERSTLRLEKLVRASMAFLPRSTSVSPAAS